MFAFDAKAAKTSEEDVQKLACSCFRLNSLQMAALLSQEKIPRNLIDTAIRMAESVADELTRGDDREVISNELLAFFCFEKTNDFLYLREGLP